MKQHIAHVAFLIDDYDEAIQFYTGKLQFILVEDTALSERKRWVLVSPKGSNECCLLLAAGDQAGGRGFLFLYTDDFWRDYNNMVKEGIEFITAPKVETYGTVAVSKDLYGNLWDLLEPKK